MTFPVALDDTSKYPASNAYGLTSVPTLFLIAENGDIEKTVGGWSKADMDAMDNGFSDSRNATRPLFGRDEEIAEFRAG